MFPQSWQSYVSIDPSLPPPVAMHLWAGRANRPPVWMFPDGEYTPVVADRERVYVVGYRRVFAFARRRPS
jgi:hypothetical protein